MKASWMVLLAAPAVALAYDPNTLVPAGALRHTVASTVAVAIITLSLWPDKPRKGSDPTRGYRTPRPLFIVGLALAAWLTLATATGVDRWSGLVGTPDRRFGLVTWLIVIASVGAGARLTQYRRSATLGATVAAFTLGIVSMAELVGWTPPGSLAAAGRWSGLWGQPAFLASAALLFGFVSLGDALDPANHRARRAAGWIGAVGSGIALVGSGTRGALVGAGAGALIWILLRRPQPQVLAGTSLAAAGAAAIGASQARGLSRLDEWEIGLRALGGSPWLGYGPEGYRIVFGRHVTASYRLAYGAATYTDRAHQGIIDLALVGGLIAVALFVAAIAIATRTVWIRRSRLTTTEIAMVAAVGAYLGAQQTLFPVASLEPTAGLYLGLVVGVPLTGAVIAPSSRLRWLVPATAIGAATVLAIAGGAEVLAERGLASEISTNRIDAQPVLDSVALRPDSIRVRYAAAQLLVRRESILDLDLALDQLERALKWSPGDPALNQRYLELLVLRGLRSESERDQAAAWTQAETVIAADPLNPNSLRTASDAARLAGNHERADNLAVLADNLSRKISPD